jgi:NADH dehydrogenase [ubiquinone] 1 alpha subcomplex assembly factor 5
MQPPEIFDRSARRTQRGRTSGGGFFAETIIEDVLERLDAVTRSFANALVIGVEPELLTALKARGISATVVDPGRGDRIEDEDHLTFAGGPFDLIIAIGTLDTVSDLPGALLLIRRALTPGGLMLAAFPGAPSLTALRQAVATADAATGRAIQRLHPQIDVRGAGDLLVRAGFHMPVADMLTINAAYADLSKLIADLRAAGATNVLAERHGVTRCWLAAASTAFAGAAGPDGRTVEQLSFITLTGWAAP